jgi:metal-sulfur cluster biosynthetic enzyme
MRPRLRGDRDAERLHALLTMTSPACPVADLIVEDSGASSNGRAGGHGRSTSSWSWVPAWTADRMSARAKAFMGW